MSKLTTLIIVRGNSGSGKTTTAKQLQEKLGDGVLLISQDTIRRDMLSVKDGPTCPAIEWIEQLARYGNGRVSYVIIEGILRRDWYGQMLKGLIEEFNQALVYYFDLPFAETLKRHQTKAKATEFGEKELNTWWLTEDFLEVANEQRIGPNVTEAELLKEIMMVLPQRGEGIVLQTARCIVRSFEERDISSFIAYRNNQKWMQYQGFKGLTETAYKETLLTDGTLFDGKQLAIVSLSTNQLIGDIFLKLEKQVLWLGYTIAPEFGRQGYAYEVVSELIHWAKSHHYTVKAGVLAGNQASIGLLAKLGFTYLETVEGELIYQLCE